MDFLAELVLEIFLEGGLEYGTSDKVPRWVRVLIFVFLALFLFTIDFFLFYLGLIIVRENILTALFLLGLGVYLFGASLFQLRKIYQKIRGKKPERISSIDLRD